MRKLTVLCLGKDSADALLMLRELGVLHVVPTDAKHADAAGAVDAARQALARTQAALAALPSDGAEANAPASAPTSPPPIHASDVVVEVHRVLAAQQAVDQELAQLHAEHAAQASFGDFDPDAARALGSHGVALRLYQFPSKEAPAAPAGTSLQAVSSAGGTTCAVLVGPPEATLAAREVPLPARSLAAIARALDAAQQRHAALAAELGALGAARGTVATRVKELEDELQLQQARAAMGSEQALAWITGFVPQDAVDGVLAAAARAGWAVSVCAPDAADVVPTKLQSKPWVRQVHAVLDMIGITPGYGEADVSALFLVFLVVFAAMLIGDAGYGALILFGVFLARRKWRHAPAQPFHLLRSVGVATVAWGVVTGTYFAIPTVPAFLDVLRIEWLAGADKAATSKHVMLLCFALGAIHITIAHLWSAWRMGKSLAALAQLGWIASTWCMFCIARTMVLGDPFPAFMIPVTVAGVAAVVLFMTPVRQLKDEWFNHVMLPLSLVSNFVDVVSYLRLFAVGTAGVAVASSFNDMAARIGADGGFSVVLAALVAIFGHTLNLVLCAMGVLVHGVRLNTLEFSAHMGLQWSGVPYRPLQRRAVGAPPTDLTAQSSITSGRT